MSQIEELLKSAKQTKDLSGKDLSKAKLSGVDLSGYNLSKTDLSRARLNGANLRGALLDGANLSKAVLKDADISGVRGTGVDLRGAALEDVKAEGLELVDVNLGGAVIKQGTWSDVTLRNLTADGLQVQKTNFDKLRIDGAKISEMVLGRVKLADGRFNNVNMELCRLNDTTFSACRVEQGRWSKSDLSLCRFEGTSFDKLDLSRSDFSGSVIKDTRFRDCRLERTVFLATDWQGSDISGGELKAANFKYARGLKPEQELRLRQAGAKVSRHLVKRTLRWMLKTNLGRVTLVALIIAIFVAVKWFQNNPDFWSYEKIIQVANQELSWKDLEDAELLFQVVLKKYDGIPDYTNPAHLGLARIAAQRKDERALEREVSIVLDAPTTNPDIQQEVWMIRVDYYMELRQPDKALDLLQNSPWAIDSSEGFATNVNDRKVQILRAQGRLDLAEAELKEFINRVSPDSESAWRAKLQLGGIYHELKRLDEAFVVFREVVDGASQVQNVFQAYNELASLYREIGRIDLEKQLREEIVQRFPEESEQLIQNKVQMATLAHNEGRDEEAIRMLNEVLLDQLASDYTRISILSDMASWDIAKGRYDEARKYYNRALELKPDGDLKIGILFAMADLERQAGDMDAAEKVYLRALDDAEDQNQRYQILFNLGNFLSSEGKRKEALNRLKEAQEIAEALNNDELSSNVAVSLARVYRGMGNREQALQILNGLLTKDNSNQDRENRIQIAQIQREMGQPNKALDTLSAAAEKYKSEPETWIQIQLDLCDMSIEADQRDRAKKVLSDLIDKHYGELGPQLGRTMGLLHTLEMSDQLRALASRISADETIDASTRIDAIRQLAQIERDGGKTEQAMDLLKQVLDSSTDPNITCSVVQDLANIYNESGRQDDAIKLLTDNLEQEMSVFNRVMLVTLLAQLYNGRDQAKRSADVLEDLEKPCQDWTGQECLPAMDLLAQTYEMLGQDSKAKQMYQRIVDKFPDSGYDEEAKRHL